MLKLRRGILTATVIVMLTLTGCFGNNNSETTNPTKSDTQTPKANTKIVAQNEDGSVSEEMEKPTEEEITCKLHIALPFLENDASDMTITFSPNESNIDKTVITVTAKEINEVGDFNINLKKVPYTIHISPPKNPDGSTYDMSATNHDVPLDTLSNVVENPEIIIVGSII